MRHIIIGDIHGCLKEFEALLSKLAITSEDKLYSVGDACDKGLDVLGCIRLIRQLNFTMVRGNHEDKAIRFLAHEASCKKTGRKNPMTSVSEEEKRVFASFTEDEIQWLNNLPIVHYIDEFNTVIVHGGFLPGLPIDVQVRLKPREVIRLRFVDNNTGTFVGLTNGPDQLEGTVLWSEVYDGTKNVVYGHISHSLETPRIDKGIVAGVECIGIDTGAVVGGRLTAYILETKEFVQVQAEKQYADFWKAE